MAFTYITSASGYGGAAGTSLNCAGTLNVAAHDVLICNISTNDGTGGTLKCWDSGSNTFTLGPEIYDSPTLACYVSMGYILDAAENATATFTFTNSTSRGGRIVQVLQFRPDAGDTISLDPVSSNPAVATGESAGTITSGSIATGGDDTIVVAFGRNYSTGTWSSQQIGGTNATAVASANTRLSAWYRILTEAMSSGNATGVHSAPDYWVCGLIGIKGVPSGPTPIQVGESGSSEATDDLNAVW